MEQMTSTRIQEYYQAATMILRRIQKNLLDIQSMTAVR